MKRVLLFAVAVALAPLAFVLFILLVLATLLLGITAGLVGMVGHEDLEEWLLDLSPLLKEKSKW